jgi:hypothetical protein
MLQAKERALTLCSSIVFTSYSHLCRNPNLELTTKVRGCKVAGQKKDSRITSHAPKSAKSVKEWTFTLPSGLPCWELDSQMDSQIFRAWLQGSKPIAFKSYFYHWKAIKIHMSKMGSHYPFGHLKHKLWAKERSWIKLTIWFPTIKSRELILFPTIHAMCNIPLESSW